MDTYRVKLAEMDSAAAKEKLEEMKKKLKQEQVIYSSLIGQR